MNDPILLIDDDPSLLAALQRQLHKDFNLTLAQGGDAALAAVSRANERQEPFAVVVCDMRMPGMDGLEVLKRITAQSPDTVRIMLTGKVDQQTAVDAINMGNVFRFFAKPCRTEDLAEGLHAALAQYRSVKAERDLLERLGYPRSKERLPGAWDSGRVAETGEEGASFSDNATSQEEASRLRQLATAAEARKDIQDMVGYDIVNHDRLIALAENIWRSVPENKRYQYTAKQWQADIYDKCHDAMVKAEKKLAETNPDPRMLKASVNILRRSFSQQVIRAMQEISAYYSEYAAKAKEKPSPK